MENNIMDRATDIANRLGMNIRTVREYLKPSNTIRSEAAQTVRRIATEMGYDPVSVQKTIRCAECGMEVAVRSYHQKYCATCSAKRDSECKKRYHLAHAPYYYRNGNYRTLEEETARMLSLREEGYSNAEIAQRVGRKAMTVLRRIGKQDAELSKRNVAMGAHFRAQRNAARRAYVISAANKVIAAHNEKIQRAQKMAQDVERRLAELEAMRAEIASAQDEIGRLRFAICEESQSQSFIDAVGIATVKPATLL